MIRQRPIWALMISLCAGPGIALAAPLSPAVAARPFYSVAGTSIGALLDNQATKTVLEKYIPSVIDNPQITLARPLTLKQLEKFANGKITDADLARIDSEIAKIPASKS